MIRPRIFPQTQFIFDICVYGNIAIVHFVYFLNSCWFHLSLLTRNKLTPAERILIKFSMGNFNIDLRCHLNVHRNPWKENRKIYRVPSAKAKICETFNGGINTTKCFTNFKSWKAYSYNEYQFHLVCLLFKNVKVNFFPNIPINLITIRHVWRITKFCIHT